MADGIGLAHIGDLARVALAGSSEAIAAVADLAQRLSGIDITVVSEVTADGRYVFRALEARGPVPVGRDDAIPYPWSLCSRIHAGESPATVAETKEVPALWNQWLRLKEGLGVDWDVRAFCTRDVTLPDGSLFGTICFHHWQPRSFSADEEALLEVLARLLGQEIWRERAAAELERAATALAEAEHLRFELAEELRHELRAPLQVIDGYAEAMVDGVLAADGDHLALVRGEAARATRLLDDIIDLTRSRPGRTSARSRRRSGSTRSPCRCASSWRRSRRRAASISRPRSSRPPSSAIAAGSSRWSSTSSGTRSGPPREAPVPASSSRSGARARPAS